MGPPDLSRPKTGYVAFTGTDSRVGRARLGMTKRRTPGRDSLYAHVPYEHGAVVPAGAVLFTAGACPLDSQGGIVGINDPVARADVALGNLILALARFGARPEDLVKTTIFVVGERSALVAVWNVISAGLAPLRPPSTLMGVSVLGYEGQLVEIEGIAVVPDRPRVQRPWEDELELHGSNVART
jgi:enamine deaminase RidA (YjgF/YER057c/UK114 family)